MSSGSGQSLDQSVHRLGMGAMLGCPVRAAGAAGLGAGAQRLGDDPADGAGAAATLGAASEAAIDLAGRTRRHGSGVAHHATHIVVGQNVAGTDYHREDHGPGSYIDPIGRPADRPDAKGKAAILSDSKLPRRDRRAERNRGGERFSGQEELTDEWVRFRNSPRNGWDGRNRNAAKTIRQVMVDTSFPKHGRNPAAPFSLRSSATRDSLPVCDAYGLRHRCRGRCSER